MVIPIIDFVDFPSFRSDSSTKSSGADMPITIFCQLQILKDVLIVISSDLISLTHSVNKLCDNLNAFIDFNANNIVLAARNAKSATNRMVRGKAGNTELRMTPNNNHCLSL